jgi:hypothetical protein
MYVDLRRRRWKRREMFVSGRAEKDGKRSRTLVHGRRVARLPA